MSPRRPRIATKPGWAGAIVLSVVVPVAAPCGSGGGGPAQATQVDLTATLDLGAPNGGPPQTWKVTCPNPQHVAACARLVTAKGAFTPPPAGSACTLIYGGPEVLTVTGNVGSRQVDYRTGRTNGCEIADYNRDLALVAPFRPVGDTPTAHTAT